MGETKTVKIAQNARLGERTFAVGEVVSLTQAEINELPVGTVTPDLRDVEVEAAQRRAALEAQRQEETRGRLDLVRCVALDGFKLNASHLNGRPTLIGKGQQIELPRADFDRLAADSLVRALGDVEQEQALAEQQARAEEQRRQAEAAELQAQSQREFNENRARLLAQREAGDLLVASRAARIRLAAEKSARADARRVQRQG